MRKVGAAAGAAGAIGGGLALFSGWTARRIEAAVPQDGGKVQVGADSIHFVDRGSGRPILMIHGLAGQMRNFHRILVDDLAQDHHVVLVDRPGSGYSTRGPGRTAGLEEQAETIAAFIRQLGLERPLLVGHSLGGALSLRIALDHPDLVGGLALVAPLTQDQSVEDVPPVFRGLVIRSPLLRRIASWTVATPLGMATAQAALTEIFAPEPVPPEFGVEGGGLLAMRPSGFYASSSDLVALEGALPAMVARYPDLQLPVSILYAREDNLLDCRLHGEGTAAQISGAEIELVEGGHMLPFTQPERTAAFVRRAAQRLWGEVGDAGADRG